LTAEFPATTFQYSELGSSTKQKTQRLKNTNAASRGSLLWALYCAKMGAQRPRNKVAKVSCPAEGRRPGAYCLAWLWLTRSGILNGTLATLSAELLKEDRTFSQPETFLLALNDTAADCPILPHQSEHSRNETA